MRHRMPVGGGLVARLKALYSKCERHLHAMQPDSTTYLKRLGLILIVTQRSLFQVCGSDMQCTASRARCSPMACLIMLQSKCEGHLHEGYYSMLPCEALLEVLILSPGRLCAGREDGHQAMQ